VAQANVNLASNLLTVTFDDAQVSPEQVRAAVVRAGYDLIIDEDHLVERQETAQRQAFRRLTARLLVVWLFAIPMLLLSMVWMHAPYAEYWMLGLALPVLAIFGRDFFVHAWKQWRIRQFGMDTLVALSTSIAFLFSVSGTFFPTFWLSRGLHPHVYYEASVMIIAFVLTGKWLEERAKQNTSVAIRGLMGLRPTRARVVRDGVETDIPLEDLRAGDRVVVRPGEQVSVDGTVVGGTSQVNESMISGEAAPVDKHIGSPVYAGAINQRGTLTVVADRVGQETLLLRIIRMVQEAQGSKAPVQRVADRIIGVFVPTVVGLAALTFILWMLIGGTAYFSHALLSSVSVLVIACPCALGLATPTALSVGIGQAARQHILVKDAVAMELLRKVDTVVFDKTGTLTEGYPSDALRPTSAAAVAALQSRHYEVHLLSGDKEPIAAALAAQLHIDHYKAENRPQDKETYIRKLQAEGKIVAMVGDGINDSQALAVADVGIAMGQGTDVAMDVAMVTLMTSDLLLLPTAFRISKRTVTLIKQNLFWAFIYNLIGIPVAAGVLYPINGILLDPMLAGAAMAFSSVSVVLNSLRLRKV
jgi:Cu2+-exporting ATPase